LVRKSEGVYIYTAARNSPMTPSKLTNCHEIATRSRLSPLESPPTADLISFAMSASADVLKQHEKRRLFTLARACLCLLAFFVYLLSRLNVYLLSHPKRLDEHAERHLSKKIFPVRFAHSRPLRDSPKHIHSVYSMHTHSLASLARCLHCLASLAQRLHSVASLARC